MASESSRELDRWQATIAFDSVLAIWIEIREVKAAGLTIDSFSRAVAQLGRAPGSGPGGRGFKSHQPDFNSDCRVVAAPTDREFKIDQPDLNYGFSNNVSLLRVA